MAWNRETEMRVNRIAAAIGLIICNLTPLGAWAAPQGFCDGYARNALSQTEERREHQRECGWVNPKNPRWNGDYEHHYQWCLGASKAQADE